MTVEFNISNAWQRWRASADLADYNSRWDRMEAEGASVHDEANFVRSLLPNGAIGSVLDAGCGTGRVAAELARRGLRVVGVDNDADMLAYAAEKPEPVRWELADLAAVDLGERFDGVVMAGNVLTFVKPPARVAVVGNLARHLKSTGRLVVGSGEADGCTFSDMDRWCEEADLLLLDSFSTWDGQPFAGGTYRVSVHRLVR